MKAPRSFTSPLAADIVRYLTVKQALGREYDGVRRVLAHIDHFVTTRGGDLTPDTFAGWCLTLQHLASGTRRHRIGSCGISASIDDDVCRRPSSRMNGCSRPSIR